MSARPYHKRYHSDALAGFMSLTLEERGAFQTLLDLMYDRQGPLLDNERLLAGYMGVSIRKWRALRSILIEKGKIAVNQDGNLTNARFEKELENDAKTARKLAENGSKGGRNRAENEKNTNENNDGGQAPLEPGLSHIRDQIPELDKKEEKEEVTAGAVYAFAGEVIRLTELDFARWEKSFPLLDLRAVLQSRDDWLANAAEEKLRKNWFIPTSNYLAKLQQAARTVEREPDAWSVMP